MTGRLRCERATPEPRFAASVPTWSSSKWKTMEPAFRLRSSPDSLTRSSAPRKMAPDWDCQLQPISLKSTEASWSLKPSWVKAPPSRSCSPPSTQSEMARILIIDDDAPVATALQAALRSEGNQVEIATDADAGLSQAEREDFDVVITDLHWVIPGSKRREAKGLELIERLHRGKPSLPIILMTAYPATDTTIRATGCGAYDYIPKPGTLKEMNELVKAVHKAAY